MESGQFWYINLRECKHQSGQVVVGSGVTHFGSIRIESEQRMLCERRSAPFRCVPYGSILPRFTMPDIRSRSGTEQDDVNKNALTCRSVLL